MAEKVSSSDRPHFCWSGFRDHGHQNRSWNLKLLINLKNPSTEHSKAPQSSHENNSFNILSAQKYSNIKNFNLKYLNQVPRPNWGISIPLFNLNVGTFKLIFPENFHFPNFKIFETHLAQDLECKGDLFKYWFNNAAFHQEPCSRGEILWSLQSEFTAF